MAPLVDLINVLRKKDPLHHENIEYLQGGHSYWLFLSCLHLRYQDQLAQISEKDLTVSPSLETSPLVLAILLVSVLLNMAAAPQLASIVSNILSNRDRSVGPETGANRD